LKKKANHFTRYKIVYWSFWQ